MSLFARSKKEKIKLQKKYQTGFAKSNFNLLNKIATVSANNRALDNDYFNDLEEALIMCDVGVKMTLNIVSEVKSEVKLNNITDPALIFQILMDKMAVIYMNRFHFSTECNIKPDRLNFVLVSGVNGSGKTTTIAKISNWYRQLGYKILVVAADTFRSGAVEQVAMWCRRTQVDCYKPEHDKQSCASVVYGALQFAVNNQYNLVICDTSGRLQNKLNLMKELTQVVNVSRKFVPDGPHEHILVLDSTIGQNGLVQAQVFKDSASISALVLTKIDGTSKGGIILAIQDELNIPVKFLCFGEQVDDIAEFDLDAYIHALISNVGKTGDLDFKESANV